jgi:hypothetical protein
MTCQSLSQVLSFVVVVGPMSPLHWHKEPSLTKGGNLMPAVAFLPRARKTTQDQGSYHVQAIVAIKIYKSDKLPLIQYHVLP